MMLWPFLWVLRALLCARVCIKVSPLSGLQRAGAPHAMSWPGGQCRQRRTAAAFAHAGSACRREHGSVSRLPAVVSGGTAIP